MALRSMYTKRAARAAGIGAVFAEVSQLTEASAELSLAPRYREGMAQRLLRPDYAEVLVGAGFRRDVRSGAEEKGALHFEVYRRPAGGMWYLEARQRGDEGCHVDVGLTLEPPGAGALIGPIHRALSAGALASALPNIIASLEGLAATAQTLRCPGCNAYVVMQDSKNGPFLSCSQPRMSRRPFAIRHKVEKCRGNLAMPALLVYG